MIYTIEDVKNFCDLVGDTNLVHNESIGVVPGILVTSAISNKPQGNFYLAEVKVKFVNPLLVNEEFEVINKKVKEKLNAVFVNAEIKTKDKIIQRVDYTLIRYNPESPIKT